MESHVLRLLSCSSGDPAARTHAQCTTGILHLGISVCQTPSHTRVTVTAQPRWRMMPPAVQGYRCAKSRAGELGMDTYCQNGKETQNLSSQILLRLLWRILVSWFYLRCPESSRPDSIRSCPLPCKTDCIITPFSEWSTCPSSCLSGKHIFC